MTETPWSAHARARIALAAKALVAATTAQETSKAMLAECEAAGIEDARGLINTLAQVQMGDIAGVEAAKLNILVQQKLVLLACEAQPEPAPAARPRRRKVKGVVEKMPSAEPATDEAAQ